MSPIVEHPSTIRIVIADDHKILRQGLKAALRSEGDIEVVAEAATGFEAVNLCEAMAPDVVLLDITMPEMSGLVAARMILTACRRTKVLILSTHSNEDFVSEALRLGVNGYVLKSSSLDDLIAAVRAVAGGETYLSPEIATFVVKEFVGAGTANGTLKEGALSAREQQVLQLIAEGVSNEQIASRLSLSTSTVRHHRENIMVKLNIHDVTGLVKYAIRTGLIEL
ncbi:MAG: response regulator [Candidatus Geothermincolia bacterium]